LKKPFQKLYMALVFIFLYAPIIVLIVFSFNETTSRGIFTGFSLKWYKMLFQDDYILSALQNTLLIAVLSSIIATILGTMAALGIHNMKPVSKALVMNITNIPVVNADIVTGISLMLVFIFVGIQLGPVTMLIAHITFNTPYVILSVLPKLRQLNRSTYEAALDLGASPRRAFWTVVLPELMPGIITGFLLSFTLSIDDFIISYFTTGAGFQNLSMAIYSMTRRGIKPTINALSALMFIVIMILMIIINIRQAKELEKIKK